MEQYLKQILLIVVIFCVKQNLAESTTVQSVDPDDEPIRFMERVKFYGYTAEEYDVQSDDGYNLILHRISGGPNNPPKFGKKVVYVQHGLLMSTDQFVTNKPGIDFVYLLVDAGYDVWLGNCRGNVYSRTHETLLPADEKFWNFSYHEAAVHDVKAFIDYTLKFTKEEKFVYIGFSLGTTYGFVFFSHYPEYNDKVALIVNIGTIALWHHNNHLLVEGFGLLTKYFERFNSLLKVYEFSLQLKHIGPLTTNICESKNYFVKILCRVLFSIMIPNMKFDRVPEGSLGRMLRIFPAGTSMKTIFHLGQNARSGNLSFYDHGKLNEEIYGTETPPNYPLQKITAPVAIYYGLNDLFAAPQDVLDLQKVLPNVILCKEIPDKYFGHFDIVLNGNARKVLFDDFIELITQLH